METEISKKVLTEKFEIDIIELPKAKKLLEKNKNDSKNQKLLLWTKFLKKANEELEKLKQDEINSWYALRRQGAVVDEKLRLSYATRKGIEQEKIEIAKKMIKQGIDIKNIIICTGLSKDEVEKLLKKVNKD